MAVFADTGYWLALWRPRDPLHAKAVATGERLGSIPVVTTQLVLTEALNGMTDMGQYHRGLVARAVRDLENDPSVEVVPQTDTQFQAAVERYAARADQRWSLTDCASFIVMEERGITDALAHDRDFEQAGFVALLRE